MILIDPILQLQIDFLLILQGDPESNENLDQCFSQKGAEAQLQRIVSREEVQDLNLTPGL